MRSRRAPHPFFSTVSALAKTESPCYNESKIGRCTQKKETDMKRIAFFFLALLFLIPSLHAGALELPTVSMESGALSADSASAGPGGSFEVTIYVSENPGICTLSLELNFDDTLLRLEGVKGGFVFGNTEWNPDKENPYLITWVHSGAENITATGALCTLRFTVLSDAAAGATEISITCKDAFDTDLALVPFAPAKAEVTLLEVAVGDLNTDRAVNSADAIYLLYHTLLGGTRYPVTQNTDYNKDGKTDSADAIYLLYHTLLGGTRYPL